MQLVIEDVSQLYTIVYSYLWTTKAAYSGDPSFLNLILLNYQ